MFTEMKNWLYKAGGLYDKLKVANLGKGYRGAIATKAIKVKIILFRKNNRLYIFQNPK